MSHSERIRRVKDDIETARETLSRILASDTEEYSFDDGEGRVRRKQRSPEYYEQYIDRREQELLSLSGEARRAPTLFSLRRG